MVGSSTSTKVGAALRLPALFALLLAGMPAGAGELRLVIEGEAGVRNDGNLEQRAQIEATGSGDEEDRNVARGGLSFQLSYDLPRADLALIYSPSYEESIDDSEISGTTHRLDLGYEGELTRRLRLRVRERLLKSPNLDLYAPLSVAEPVAVTRRGDQLSHGLDVGFEHDLTRRAVLVVGAQHSLRTFDGEELEDAPLYDTETLVGTLGATFSLAEDRQLGVSASAGEYDYERRGEADVQNVGVSYSQGWGRSGRVSVEAGLFSVESTLLRRGVIALPDAPDEAPGPPVVEEVLTEEEDEGWRGAVSVSRQGRFIGWNLGYRHDVSAGFGLGEPTEADSAFAGLSYSPTRRLTLGLDGNASRHEPLGDSERAVGTLLQRQDTLNEFAAGTARLSWTFFQGLRLTGGYSRIWQSSEVEPFEDLSYDRFFLGLAFRVWSSGETPREPDDPQGELTDEARDDQEPDAR
ncbi:MAG TPA: hypothetical protein VEL74_15180 [Thermoanaerobaculia bacterium]|nr:hypothetical protein [Thermoanaerobaculia bacterium]